MITRDALKQGFTKRRHWFLVGALAAGLALGLGQAPVAYGATIFVSSTEDTAVPGDGHCTLREAINNANGDADTTGGDCLAGSGADSIDFNVSGTIRLLSTLPNISEDLTMDGAEQSLTISGNDAVQVMIVNAGVTFKLQELTVARGRSGEGAGILNNGGTLTISNSTFSGNSTHDYYKGYKGGGGGIFNGNGGTLTITNSTFSGNRTSNAYYAGSGGGIFNGGGTLTITNSTFSGNSTRGYYSSGNGGGIFNGGGTLTITNSIFSGNSVSHGHDGGSGGGIFNEGGTLSITNSTFSGNSVILSQARSSGGGIFNEGGTLTITNSTFSGNSAGGQEGGFGGGIANSGMLSVTNSTFSRNSATATGDQGSGGFGGGIANSGMLGVTSSTFSDNSADAVGGGIFNGDDGTTTLHNTIIANSSSGGNCSDTITDGGGNLRWPNTDPTCVGSFGDPKLGPLADNGGPTQTMALLPGSAAIDAGVNATCAANPVNNLDQRGVLRPVDGDGDGSAICDIGAYERQVERGAGSIWQIGSFDGSKNEFFVGARDSGFKCDSLPSDSLGSQGPFVLGTHSFSAFPGEISSSDAPTNDFRSKRSCNSLTVRFVVVEGFTEAVLEYSRMGGELDQVFFDEHSIGFAGPRSGEPLGDPKKARRFLLKVPDLSPGVHSIRIEGQARPACSLGANCIEGKADGFHWVDALSLKGQEISE